MAATFYEILPNSIREVTPVSFSTSMNERRHSASDFTTTKLPYNKSELEVTIPSDSVISTIPNRYIFFMEDYLFSYRTTMTGGDGYAGHETKPMKVLEFSCKFYLWDKDQGKAISWGELEEEKIIDNVPTKEDYRDVIDKFTNRILSESPIIVY